MVKALIFDLDGTLVDSELIGAETLAALLPELGLSGAEITARYRGWRFKTILEEFSRQTDRLLDDDFIALYRAHSSVRFENELKAFPFVEEMLETARLPFCIASSGPPEKIDRSLRVTGLARFFPEKTFSAYSINSWKPDPELFLHAAQAIGVSPQDCLVIEDSAVGVEAARRAGMSVLVHAPEGEIIADSPSFSSYAGFHALVDDLFLNKVICAN